MFSVALAVKHAQPAAGPLLARRVPTTNPVDFCPATAAMPPPHAASKKKSDLSLDSLALRNNAELAIQRTFLVATASSLPVSTPKIALEQFFLIGVDPRFGDPVAPVPGLRKREPLLSPPIRTLVAKIPPVSPPSPGKQSSINKRQHISSSVTFSDCDNSSHRLLSGCQSFASPSPLLFHRRRSTRRLRWIQSAKVLLPFDSAQTNKQTPPPPTLQGPARPTRHPSADPP